MKVQVLSPEIISKIAAGEVIERPASVVKELLENSLDAASTRIAINLQAAGKTSIQVQDNGSGIDTDDAGKIFLRHSTSKLSTIDDLFHILSLGFRGEALYSISAVSDIMVRSKTKIAETGWEAHQRAGQSLGTKPAAMNIGTEITVQELFFNTPARKKFLKTDSAELTQILNCVIPYTLLYPQLQYLLTNNQRTLLDCAPQDSFLKRCSSVLNLDAEHLLEAKHEFPRIKATVHLILGDINIQRPKKDLQYIFVNNRPVQNRSLNWRINEAYRLLLPAGANPFFILFLNLPAENVDVNIHPTKREVKIKDEYSFGSLIHDLCTQTLVGKGKAKQWPVAGSGERPLLSKVSTLPRSDEKSVAIEKETVQYTFRQETSPAPVREPSETYSTGASLKNILAQSQFIGCFIKKYLLFETGNSLIVVDQHAAHERINFEALKNQLDKGKVEVQQLLSPILIKLSPEELLNWEEGKEKIETLGLSTTLWDKQTIALHAHPLLIKNPEVSIRSLLAPWVGTTSESLSRCDNETLARRACRQSVMAGKQITREEAENLRKLLLNCKDPFTCPHGRPMVVEIREKQLAKYFLR